MFQHFKDDWANMDPMSRIIYAGVLISTVLACFLVIAEVQFGLAKGGQYGFTLLGLAAALQGIKTWKTSKILSTFLVIFGLVFLITGISKFF